jgi:hypothetical protein
MPTASETVPNKALSGAELKTIMLERFKHLLAGECMLADHVAYGRITYDITLRMHIDNPFVVGGVSVSTIAAQPVGRNITASAPELEAIESGPPLKGPLTREATASGSRISEEIRSPNRARLAAGLPVPVDVRQRDGSILTEAVTYPPQEELSDAKLEDITAETRRELGSK